MCPGGGGEGGRRDMTTQRIWRGDMSTLTIGGGVATEDTLFEDKK